MNETTFSGLDFEHDINQKLDKVLPYEPYERTALDIVLIEEANLMAGSRMLHVHEVLDEEEVTNGMLRSIRASEVYDEHYPGIDRSDDAEFTIYGASGPWILKKYGSLEAQSSIEVSFGAKYPSMANSAVLECVARKFTVEQAQDYLHAVLEFTQDLHDVSHISEDKLLHAPFLQLGVRLAHVFGGNVTNFAELFNTYLKEKVIGHENLVGEDGIVAEDMTLSFYKWVEERVDEYFKNGAFRLPQVFSYDDIAIKEDRFAVYGSDAQYFREIEKRRLKNEVEVVS